MLTCCWSPKGGTGTTTVACTFAAHRRSRGARTLLIDLAGDAAAAFGVTSDLGIGHWLAPDATAGVDSLVRLEVGVADGLSLLAAGEPGPVAAERVDALMAVVHETPREVVVDCGVVGGSPPRLDRLDHLAHRLLERADRSLAVLRPCYLALRRFTVAPDPTHVLLVDEPGRALRRADVAAQIGAASLIVVPQDPAVARLVDAGLVGTRLPRTLRRAYENIA